MKFSPDGSFFISASSDRTVRLYCTHKTNCLRLFMGHNDDVNCCEWHPNCRLIASGSDDKIIRLWEVKSGYLLFIIILYIEIQ